MGQMLKKEICYLLNGNKELLSLLGYTKSEWELIERYINYKSFIIHCEKIGEGQNKHIGKCLQNLSILKEEIKSKLRLTDTKFELLLSNEDFTQIFLM
jgi:protein-arginine kinase activator protein McsA